MAEELNYFTHSFLYHSGWHATEWQPGKCSYGCGEGRSITFGFHFCYVSENSECWEQFLSHSCLFPAHPSYRSEMWAKQTAPRHPGYRSSRTVSIHSCQVMNSKPFLPPTTWGSRGCPVPFSDFQYNQVCPSFTWFWPLSLVSRAHTGWLLASFYLSRNLWEWLQQQCLQIKESTAHLGLQSTGDPLSTLSEDATPLRAHKLSEDRASRTSRVPGKQEFCFIHLSSTWHILSPS